jgi:hypothetical protein
VEPFQIARLPAELIPAYREQQARRLLRNVRVTLPGGSVVALAFIPWSRMHDQANQLPTTEVGIFLSLGMIGLFLLTFLAPLKSHLELIVLTAYVFGLSVASVNLAMLPDGFLYGVGTLLGFTVVATVIAVDVSAFSRVVMASSFLVIPNSALAITGEPWIMFMNTNWILVSGGLIAFGLAFLMDQTHRTSFLLEHALAAEKARLRRKVRTRWILAGLGVLVVVGVVWGAFSWG